MSDDMTPDTEPAGSLVPPAHRPPTAVGAPDVPPQPPLLPRMRRAAPPVLVEALERILDTLDDIGDSIARVAGIRRDAEPGGG